MTSRRVVFAGEPVRKWNAGPRTGDGTDPPPNLVWSVLRTVEDLDKDGSHLVYIVTDAPGITVEKGDLLILQRELYGWLIVKEAVDPDQLVQ